MRFSFIVLMALTLSFGVAPSTYADNVAPTPAATQPQIAAPAAPGIAGGTPTAVPKMDPDEYLVKAKEAYKEGQLKQSLVFIDKAQAGIRAQRAELFRPLLPPTPENWQANDSADNKLTLSSAMVGGMSVTSREYKGYGHTITIGYITDSPMFSMMSGIMKAVGSIQGNVASTEDVKGNQAFYKETSEGHKGPSHELMIFAGDVTVVLQSATLPKETLIEFANIVPYDKLKAVK